jgi:glycosyltransferase involved in cell wall biosynthesis
VQWYEEKHPSNVTVMKGLPKEEYDELVRACDVGLIFLDHRFSIPNFPSRLLSYLENRMPVLCATDRNCDMGSIAEENGFGFWCESNSVEAFTAILDRMIAADRHAMGEMGYEFLKANYTVENTFGAIVSHIR